MADLRQLDRGPRKHLVPQREVVISVCINPEIVTEPRSLTLASLIDGSRAARNLTRSRNGSGTERDRPQKPFRLRDDLALHDSDV